MAIVKKTDLKSFQSSVSPTWCPGCGDFGIMAGIKNALSELGKTPEEVVITYDIGCGGNMNNNIKTYAFHSLHGRALPAALGVKMANHKLTVLSVAGDGGFYGEGGNHLLHLGRFNSDITAIISDNRTFSLTTGQASPTSDEGYVTKTTKWGEFKKSLNSNGLAIISGATFVARSVAFEPEHLKNILKQAIRHKGFSVVNVLQQCVSFNKRNTIEWYKEKIYDLESVGHNVKDKTLALSKCLDEEENGKIPIGVFYKETRSVYESNFPQIKNNPLISRQREKVKIKSLMKEFS